MGSLSMMTPSMSKMKALVMGDGLLDLNLFMAESMSSTNNIGSCPIATNSGTTNSHRRKSQPNQLDGLE
jgi:hypothetical protein